MYILHQIDLSIDNVDIPNVVSNNHTWSVYIELIKD